MPQVVVGTHKVQIGRGVFTQVNGAFFRIFDFTPLLEYIVLRVDFEVQRDFRSIHRVAQQHAGLGDLIGQGFLAVTYVPQFGRGVSIGVNDLQRWLHQAPGTTGGVDIIVNPGIAVVVSVSGLDARVFSSIAEAFAKMGDAKSLIRIRL